MRPGRLALFGGIFELRVMRALQKAPSVSLGRITCREYASSTFMPKADLSAEILYFKSFFFSKDGNPTEVWNKACFRDADKSEEIKTILLKSQGTFEENAEALIRIIVQFKNDFFRDSKWAYYLKGQKNNFVDASSVLVKLIPEA